MKLKLSSRLQAIASLVDKDEVVIDVGTDHALLPIYLMLEKRIDKAYASDINELPLKKANENISNYQLNDRITLLHQDGLAIIPFDVSLIVLSGMGGLLISEILDQAKSRLQENHTLIIGANNHVMEVRLFLINHHFKIIDEVIVKDGRHYYELIKAKRGEEVLTEDQLLFGPINLVKKTNEFKEKYQNELNHYQALIAKGISNLTRVEAINQYMERILKYL